MRRHRSGQKIQKKRSHKAVVSIHGLPYPRVIISISFARTLNGWHRPMESKKVHWKCSQIKFDRIRWEVICYNVPKGILWLAPGCQSQIQHLSHNMMRSGTRSVGFLRLLPLPEYFWYFPQNPMFYPAFGAQIIFLNRPPSQRPRIKKRGSNGFITFSKISWNSAALVNYNNGAIQSTAVLIPYPCRIHPWLFP